ncbi:unnamed protein product [Pylaiella littoralis]
MVKRAVGFLRHPKVKGAPQEKQITFLRDKKLSPQEIDEALKKVAELGAAEASANARAALASAPTRRIRKGPVRSEVVVSGGMVYISEQTALSPPPAAPLGGGNGEEDGRDASLAESLSAEQQTTKALESVKRLLQEAGSGPSKVVSALLCVRDSEQDLRGVNEAWGRWVDKDNPPARTVVQTGAFAVGGGSSGVRVSVTVTAHL